MLPDVIRLNREFDYLVPVGWESDGRADRLEVGSMVRVVLAGRRVAGWITAINPEPPPGIELAPLAHLTGMGPSNELVELAEWAAWRWAGKRAHFLRAASPGRVVTTAAARSSPTRRQLQPQRTEMFNKAFELGTAVVSVPPDDDSFALALAACQLGDALILVPDASHARSLARALKRSGVTVAAGMNEWAKAAAGATVVGTRPAAWAPMPRLAAVVVIDEHDERFKTQSTPSWHARDVAVERARRRGVPSVMSGSVPSLEALRLGALLRPERSIERAGWPKVKVFDRRSDDPVKRGLFSEHLGPLLRGNGKVVCILNRKGRSRLLACAQCGELVRSIDGNSTMLIIDDELRTPDGSERRPIVCISCGATSLKNLRVGVVRAAEELAALVSEPVGEITDKTSDIPPQRVLIGTEAALYRVRSAEVVVFLDLDQELTAVRQRAWEQALVLLARAARILGPRSGSGQLVLQTRQPEHEVVQAALRGNPLLLAVAERDRRKSLGIAPYGAQVLVKGAGSAEFMTSFGEPEGVRIMGSQRDGWLLRASEHAPILDAVKRTRLPPSRVRIEVDPLRV